MNIEEIKRYFESEEGGIFLLSAYAQARTRQNERFYYKPPQMEYNREREEQARRERIKKQLETPINLSCDRSDLQELIKFNESNQEEKIMALVTDQGIKFIQHKPGHAIPPLPILQSGYFPGIIRDGNGIVYDNRKQAYQVTLVD
jgi:hypothetical protein